jgi:protein SCO1
MKIAAILLLLCLSALPARAAVSQADLDSVGVNVKQGAALPLALRFTDDSGRNRTLGDATDGKPVVLVFADYTCGNLCGPILAFVAAGLQKTGLSPGKDFSLIAIGLDPKDSLDDAREMKRLQIGDMLSHATVFLSGKPAAIHAATEAAGYHAVYDREHDQFAHPGAVFILAPDGRIVRVLSGLGLSGADLRLALVDAGQGKVGSLLDQIHLRCFGFDAARGIYTASITRILALAGAATVTTLLLGMLIMNLRTRRRVRS